MAALLDGSPRACGGQPIGAPAASSVSAQSPRLRRSTSPAIRPGEDQAHSSPRACGGQPSSVCPIAEARMQSPRLRRSTRRIIREKIRPIAVPAPAAVNPGYAPLRMWQLRSPRACGGQPEYTVSLLRHVEQSPRLRRSTPTSPVLLRRWPTVPAPAAVNSTPKRCAPTPSHSPRACGGQPYAKESDRWKYEQSPRLRRSTFSCTRMWSLHTTVPAPAAVNPTEAEIASPESCSPRTCGGQPQFHRMFPAKTDGPAGNRQACPEKG